jgi:hypothetical protein
MVGAALVQQFGVYRVMEAGAHKRHHENSRFVVVFTTVKFYCST